MFWITADNYQWQTLSLFMLLNENMEIVLDTAQPPQFRGMYADIILLDAFLADKYINKEQYKFA